MPSSRQAFNLVMLSWIRLELFLTKAPPLDYHPILGMHFGDTLEAHLHLHGLPNSSLRMHQS